MSNNSFIKYRDTKLYKHHGPSTLPWNRIFLWSSMGTIKIIHSNNVFYKSSEHFFFTRIFNGNTLENVLYYSYPSFLLQLAMETTSLGLENDSLLKSFMEKLEILWKFNEKPSKLTRNVAKKRIQNTPSWQGPLPKNPFQFWILESEFSSNPRSRIGFCRSATFRSCSIPSPPRSWTFLPISITPTSH